METIIDSNLKVFVSKKNENTEAYSLICPNLTHVILSGSNIRKMDIQSNSIKYLSDVKIPRSLTELIICNSKISSIFDHKFIRGSELRTLKIEFGEIKEIINFIFPKVILYISLANNKIRTLKNINIPRTCRIIDLRNNELEELFGVKIPNSIRHLYLSNNRFKSFRTFSFPSSLQTLDLSNNKFLVLPTVTFHEGLLKLNLSGTMTKNLGNLKLPDSLQTLILNNNIISNLSSFRFNRRLVHLSLENNLIESIDDIKFPISLQTLNLKKNKIKSIDPSFSSNINILYLSDNAIQFFDFKKFLRIDELYLDHNSLSVIDSFSFPDSLSILDLSNNKIEYISDSSFLNITDLCLDNNLISSLCNIQFNDCMKKLSLFGNKIESIENVIFPFEIDKFTSSVDAFESHLLIGSKIKFLNISLNSMETLNDFDFFNTESLVLSLNKEEPDNGLLNLFNVSNLKYLCIFTSKEINKLVLQDMIFDNLVSLTIKCEQSKLILNNVIFSEKMKNMRINECQIESIDVVIPGILDKLDLSYNKISKLKVPMTKSLFLKECGLDSLDNIAFPLKIERLNFDGNKIESLGIFIPSVTSLSVRDTNVNMIDSILLPELIELDIRGSGVKSLDLSKFKRLSLIKTDVPQIELVRFQMDEVVKRNIYVMN